MTGINIEERHKKALKNNKIYKEIYSNLKDKDQVFNYDEWEGPLSHTDFKIINMANFASDEIILNLTKAFYLNDNDCANLLDWFARQIKDGIPVLSTEEQIERTNIDMEVSKIGEELKNGFIKIQLGKEIDLIKISQDLFFPREFPLYAKKLDVCTYILTAHQCQDYLKTQGLELIYYDLEPLYETQLWKKKVLKTLTRSIVWKSMRRYWDLFFEEIKSTKAFFDDIKNLIK